MTESEGTAIIVSIGDTIRTTALAVVDAARSVVPVLKDHNLNHVATGLEEALFQHDAAQQELSNFFIQHREDIISWIKEKRTEGRK